MPSLGTLGHVGVLGASAVAWLGAAVAGWASPAPAQLHLLVESITIEGLARVKPQLLLAEARLEVGQTYTESELRAALFRVRRLPFILDADLSLRRGAAPGSHELVLEVQEVDAVFFSAGLHLTAIPSGLSCAAPRTRDPITGSERGFRPLVGARIFPGRRGVAYGAVQGVGMTFSDREGASVGLDVVVGYSRYDLFGRGGVLSLSWNERGCCDPARIFSLDLDPTGSLWSLSSLRNLEHEASYPLVGDHSLRLAIASLETTDTWKARTTRERRSFHSRSLASEELSQLTHRRVELGWVWDTSDDPQLPQRGKRFTVGLVASSLDARFDRIGVPTGSQTAGSLPPWATESLTLVARGTRHWPVAQRQTVTTEARAGVGRSQFDGVRVLAGEAPVSGQADTWRLGGGLRWALSLRTADSTRQKGDLALETWGRYGVEGVRFRASGAPGELREIELGAALVLRNRWGLFVLGLSWHDLDGGSG
jgi:hypothetical protein